MSLEPCEQGVNPADCRHCNPPQMPPACDCGAEMSHGDNCSFWRFIRNRTAYQHFDERKEEAQ